MPVVLRGLVLAACLERSVAMLCSSLERADCAGCTSDGECQYDEAAAACVAVEGTDACAGGVGITMAETPSSMPTAAAAAVACTSEGNFPCREPDDGRARPRRSLHAQRLRGHGARRHLLRSCLCVRLLWRRGPHAHADVGAHA
ncbi:hypothetical protein M885DRAFT_610154, partial [Pelagophyceae sp. CCMP2097]